MAELTTTSHAILGLLARRDCTTYELAQQMRRKLHFVWPRAERKLYEEPRRLVEAGYATSVKDMIGRRARTIYTITPAGREALRNWLATPIDVPTMEFEGMVRVLFSDQADIDSLRKALERIKEQAVDERRRFELAAGASDRKNGSTHYSGGPDRRALEGLSKRFMIEHYDHMGEWAEWALLEVDRWDEAASSNGTSPSSLASNGTVASVGASAGSQSRPESSVDVVSIDE